MGQDSELAAESPHRVSTVANDVSGVGVNTGMSNYDSGCGVPRPFYFIVLSDLPAAPEPCCHPRVVIHVEE